MIQILKDIIAPFNWKKGMRGLDWKGKIIAIASFPIILVMWYGYYMWNKEELEWQNFKR